MKKLLLTSLALLITIACSEEQKISSSDSPQETELASGNLDSSSAKKSPLPITDELRNWQSIKSSGVIRVLKLALEEENSLPRSGYSTLFHIDLIQQFANQHQLEIRWVSATNLAEMFQLLAQDKADLISRHLTITSERQKSMLFTLPVKTDYEVLIADGKNDKAISEQLSVTVPENTAYIDSIRQHFPNWQLNLTPESLNSEQIADAITTGKFEYSVIDKSSFDRLSEYRQDIVALRTLPTKNQLAWAVNLGNNSLLTKLNEFIVLQHINDVKPKTRSVDLNTIKKSGQPLRIITRNSPETYFLWRGELMGFEYELMHEFAKRNNVKLEIIVADTFEDMTRLLLEGKGDIIAAGLSRTEERKQNPDMAFSIRYKRVDELLVSHKDAAPINALTDLKGRSITVRKSSAFWNNAQKLAKDYGVLVNSAEETVSTEMLIGQVADQTIDLTIADSNLVSIEKQFRDDIVTPLTLNESIPYAYILRKSNPQLLNAVNQFIRKEYRSTFYNVVKNKYFSDLKRVKHHREQRITPGSNLSPYDEIVQDKSSKYHFDWRLITSQMYQESRFNPKAKSSAGALGLMQVLPKTANELGISDLTNPVQSIDAGIRYMNWTRDRFSNDMPLQERLFFALAAYNAGFGHVRDAQRLAKQMNLNPNKWFGNVEKTMLLLQQPTYYKQARFGYCRGSEPVNYVREIYQRYLSYIKVTQS